MATSSRAAPRLHAFARSTPAALLLAALILGAATFALGPAPSEPDRMPPTVAFTTLDGRTVSARDLAGTVLLVHFWASDCVPCRKEMPRLAATYRHFRDRGFDILAVAVGSDSRAEVVHYVRDEALPFPVAFDSDGTLAHAFGDVNDTPTTFLVDGRGHIKRRYLGTADFAELERLIDLELGGNPA